MTHCTVISVSLCGGVGGGARAKNEKVTFSYAPKS